MFHLEIIIARNELFRQLFSGEMGLRCSFGWRGVDGFLWRAALRLDGWVWVDEHGRGAVELISWACRNRDLFGL